MPIIVILVGLTGCSLWLVSSLDILENMSLSSLKYHRKATVAVAAAVSEDTVAEVLMMITLS